MTAKEKLIFKLSEMTHTERKALVIEICQICEKQYRKGYQQGFNDSKNGLTTQKAVSDFRHEGSIENYSKVVFPPYFKQKASPIEIVSMELSMPDMEVLNSLFNQVEYHD